MTARPRSNRVAPGPVYGGPGAPSLRFGESALLLRYLLPAGGVDVPTAGGLGRW